MENLKPVDGLIRSDIALNPEDVEVARVNNQFAFFGAGPHAYPDVNGPASHASKYIVFLEYVSVGAGNNFGISSWDGSIVIVPALTGPDIIDFAHSPIRVDGGVQVSSAANFVYVKGFYLIKN